MYDSEMAGVEFQLRKKEKPLFFYQEKDEGRNDSLRCLSNCSAWFPKSL